MGVSGVGASSSTRFVVKIEVVEGDSSKATFTNLPGPGIDQIAKELGDESMLLFRTIPKVGRAVLLGTAEYPAVRDACVKIARR